MSEREPAAGEPRLSRFGVSMDEPLLAKFDDLIRRRGYDNRSEAIRDLVRAELVKEGWAKGTGVQAALITIVYEHEHGDLLHRLTHVQHDYADVIVSTLHVHMDADNCLEVLVVKGSAARIERLAEQIISARGVKFGELTRATTGSEI